MRILLTGATGFVGGWLTEELTRAYPDAVLFGTTTQGGGRMDSAAEGIRLLSCDLTEPDSVREAVAEARPDHLFHLAGFASGAGTDREQIFRVNVDATGTLLSALEGQGTPCRVLLASSGYVYGATAPGQPAREADPPAPSGAYAESKAAMERLAYVYGENGLLSLTVTRAFNHTGPHQTTDFVVPAFARQIARIEAGREPPVVRVGNLEGGRDFLHVRDVVRAYRLLVCETDPTPWRVVNVSQGKAVTIRFLLDKLIALAGVPVTVENDPARMRPSDLPESAGDSSLLRSLTGWQPTIGIDETLAETLDYWRDTTAADAH